MTAPDLDPRARRALGRMLSKAAIDRSGFMLEATTPDGKRPYRIGITGAPGAGKSTLIGRFAAERLHQCGSLAVLAVDPSSPLTEGSVLGDRIRMEAISTIPNVFIRSVPSRAMLDGLCENVESLLRVLENHGFEEILLETVGAGQAQHAIRAVVDTVVVVLAPGSGDSIQAMKAGLMELADVYVVNKCDLPDAARVASEIRFTISRRQLPAQGWEPPVQLVSSIGDASGLAELSAAVSRHREWALANEETPSVRRRRTRQHVQAYLERRLAALLKEIEPELWDRAPREIFKGLSKSLPKILADNEV